MRETLRQLDMAIEALRKADRADIGSVMLLLEVCRSDLMRLAK